MLITLLEHLLMLVGIVAALALLAGIWGAMLFAAAEDIKYLILHFVQSKKDTKMFHQVEEFRRDFS